MNATTVYYFVRIVSGLMRALMAAVSAIYRVDVVGLNPLQLVLTGTVLELAYFSAEIPTGVVADAYSRKLSLIIGYITMGVGFMIEGLFPTFGAVLLSQVVWGIGATFLSGAETAWLTDEVGEKQVTGVLLRGGQIGSFVAILGILLAMGIGAIIGLGAGFIISGIGFVLLGLALIPLMPETGFTPTPNSERNTWGKLTDTFRAGLATVRASRVLMLVLLIELFIGLSDEGYQRLSEPHLLENFTFPTIGNLAPIVWLGAINIVALMLNITFVGIVRRRIKDEDSPAILRHFRLFMSLSLLGIVWFAFSYSFVVGVAAYISIQLMRGIAFPLYNAWLTQQIDPKVRATVLSMWGQVNALGQMIGGPLIGFLATVLAFRVGYGLIAVLLLPVVWLIGRILQLPHERE